ncbi:MAG TPA: amidohydrolase family protein [Candidatus Didemnitutus sp.]|jgi:L-fuconolactonase
MRVPFVDSHVHFWDPARLRYNYLEGLPAIAARHGPDTLEAEARGDTPARCVFVQAECDRTQWLDEVRWVVDLARRHPRIAGIVAHLTVDIPASLPAALDLLECEPLVRGVRHLIQDEPDPRFCLRDEFVAGVHRVGQRGYVFDLCCRSHQLPSVLELVRLCPAVRFVLDHAGKPAIGRRELEPWSAQMRALAALPNIVCKLSGLVTETTPLAPTAENLRPCVTVLLETFGPSRLLFGSDWPIAKLAAGYRQWLDLATGLLSSLSAADLSAIFCDNAARTYRLS